MQRPVCSLLGALLLLVLLASWAAAQTDRILLIGGNYRIQGIVHNMQDGYFGAPSIGDADNTQVFLDTRLRLFFDLFPAKGVCINYKLEIGDITFGAKNAPIIDDEGRRLENVAGSSGGGPGSDGVNLETKNVFIDWQLPWVPGLSFRGGILGWGDQFDWTILSTDFTGLQLTYQRPALWSQFTFLKFAEGSLRTSDDDSDWFALDARYEMTPQTSITASVYFWNDNSNDNPQSGDDAYQIYAGLKLQTVFLGKGLLEISGVYNYGQEYLGQAENTSPDGAITRRGLTGVRNRGVMAHVHADYPIGKHWVGMTLQYISGESGSRASLDASGENVDAFLSLFNQQYSGFGRSRFAGGGGLELITLGQLNDSTAGLNNVSISPFFGGGYNGRLLSVARAKFYATPVLFVYTAAGVDMAAQRNANGDRFRGIEFSAYLHWDILPKLWLRAGGAYLLAGKWWDHNPDVSLMGFSDPIGLQSQGLAEDIFQFMLRLQYDFG